MGYTTPATAVAGTALTAAFLNTYLRDNVAWIATDSPACRATRGSTQSLTTATPTAIALDQERFDNAAMHDTVTNNTRITVPTGGGGKYIIGAELEYNNNSTGVRDIRLRTGGATLVASISQAAVNVADSHRMGAVQVQALSAAEYVECLGYQTSGGNLTVLNSAAYSPELWAFWFRT
jgi:hypothetical protein